MSDKRCGTPSPHGPHAWGDLNWCPGPDATASEPLSKALTEAERKSIGAALGDEMHEWVVGPNSDLARTVERIVAAHEAAAATRARAEGSGQIVCSNCEATDLGCTACGAHDTLVIAPYRSNP